MATRRRSKSDSTNSGQRIQRVLADAGVASRRACEQLVEEGSVTVNGKVMQKLPIFVDPEVDDIRVEGRRIKKSRSNVYIMLFKPRGFVCTAKDPEGRKRAIDLVNHPFETRLFTVGRLDIDSSGLLLLTDDGDLAHILTHPKFEIHKGYDVTVRGRVEEDSIERIRKGIYLADKTGKVVRTRESGITVVRRSRDRTQLRIELREGRNRQIRRLLERVGHPVKRLRRTSLGPLRLKGLAMGDWRELTSGELSTLRRVANKAEREIAAFEKSGSKKTRRRRSGSRKGRSITL